MYGGYTCTRGYKCVYSDVADVPVYTGVYMCTQGYIWVYMRIHMYTGVYMCIKCGKYVYTLVEFLVIKRSDQRTLTDRRRRQHDQPTTTATDDQ